MADARMHIKQKGVGGIEEFLKEKFQGSKDVKIRFAITGNSGTGKSAFINAIRG
jgi:putative ribosome biogenesis GTPase RsgA